MHIRLFISLLVLFSAASVSADQSFGVGLQYQTITDYDDPGVGVAARYAYALLPQFSLQSEVSATVSEVEGEVVNNFGNSVGFASAWLTTFALYGQFEQPLGSRFSVHGRVGMLSAQSEVERCISGNCTIFEGSDTDLSYGAGAAVHLSPSLSLVADWTHIAEDVQYIGLSLEYQLQSL